MEELTFGILRYVKGGVGGHSVLQKSVEWETGVDAKEYYFCYKA